jgi:D-aminopeptidase
VNGTGELTSKLEIDETGWIRTPIYLCGTHALGTVYQAAIMASGHGPQDVVIPVVGETDDGDLADSRTVVAEDVQAALESLGEEVAEGTVGGGTGMQLYDFAGGIGTASRRVGDWHVGVLLQCNFGEREYLDLLGTSLGPSVRPAASDGSCIAICATDAPLSAQQLKRLALRPLLGLVRTGSYGSEGSGEIGMAFSTVTGGDLDNDQLNPIFAAAYESAHEAVMNCLVAARPAERFDGTMQDAFPIERARQLAAG